MTLNTIAPALRPSTSGRMRVALAAITLGVIGLLLLFHAEIDAMIGVWMTSTAYNHCFLVIPIAAYLIWDRRASLVGAEPVPAPWVLVAAIPFGLAWLAAERLGIMEGRQLAALGLLELLFLSVLGLRLYAKLSGPLLYLFFLVPFGAFLTSSLQDFTTAFVVHGLNALGIPNYTDGNIIEIPEGTFLVAEACAGLRFLIASVAFGCLYALLMYRSPVRRLVFIAVSTVVPVIANGFRALGIVVLGHLEGSAQAVEADHIIYGWVFFSTVIVVLILIGLPFRQDHEQFTPPTRQPLREGGLQRGLALVSAAGLVLLAAVGPAIAGVMDAAAQTARDSTPVLLQPGPGCTAEAAHIDTSFTGGTGEPLPSISVQRFTCGNLAFDLRLARFSPLVTPAVIVNAQRWMTGEAGASDVQVHWLPGHVWRLVETSDPTSVTVGGLWVEGRPMAAGLRMRLRQALGTLSGSRYAPVVVSITPVIDFSRLGPDAMQAVANRLGGFVASQDTLATQITALSGG